ncbi:MAG: extracellular solute-binding protein [Lachnospiraceae bacterium]|nr:extracellular solute-binding protein [Lachnospiraceae bacterium]
MRKRALALLMTCALSLTALAGCGGNTDGGSSAEVKSSESSNSGNGGGEIQKLDDATAASAIDNLVANTKDTVQLTIWASEMDQEFTQTLLDQFKSKYSSVKFDFQLGIQSEAGAKDAVMADPTAAADVYAFADDQLIELINVKGLTEVSTAYTYDVATENSTSSIAAASYNGKVYAYPMTGDNGYFMYYNSSIFSAEDMVSFDKMVEVAKQKGVTIGYQKGGWYLHGFFDAEGTGHYADLQSDGSTSCNWNDQVGVDIANAIIQYAKDGVLVMADDSTAAEAFKAGTMGAVVSGTWAAQNFSDALGSNYAACIMPKFKAGGKEYQMTAYLGFKLIGVNPNSAYLPWAMLLAEYLTCEESQIARFQARQLGPSNVKAASSDAVLKDVAIAAISAQGAHGTLQRVGGNYWASSESLSDILISGNPDGPDVQKLLDDAVSGITAK